MKSNNTFLAIAAACLALLLLIGWTFYQALQLDSGGKIPESEVPQKAVMAQAQAMNEARLNELAQKGKVVVGMTEEQVRNALGVPNRIEKIDEADEHLVVWWYEQEGWTNVLFSSKGLVVQIEEER